MDNELVPLASVSLKFVGVDCSISIVSVLDSLILVSEWDRKTIGSLPTKTSLTLVQLASVESPIGPDFSSKYVTKSNTESQSGTYACRQSRKNTKSIGEIMALLNSCDLEIRGKIPSTCFKTVFCFWPSWRSIWNSSCSL